MEKEELIKILKNNFELNTDTISDISVDIGIESKKNLDLFKKLFDILDCTWFIRDSLGEKRINPVDKKNVTTEIISYLRKPNYYPYYSIDFNREKMKIFYGLYCDDRKIKAAKRNLRRLKKIFNEDHEEPKVLKIKKL